jgi:hypothetical protein
VRTYGHWVIAIYDGDPERAKLSWEDRWDNVQFAWRWFRKYHRRAPFPMHRGRIVSRPIDVYEYDNVVTTIGKGLYLDRLYAMGSAGQLTHHGVGATAAAAVIGDTQLGSTPNLKVFDSLPTRAGLVTTAVTNYLTTEANISWNEAAEFNGPTNGTSTMYNRVAPIGPFQKTTSVGIGLTSQITQG